MSNSSIWPIDCTLSDATTSFRVDQGAMAMKGYSALPKAPALLMPHHQIFNVISGVGAYPSAKMQSMYFKVQANWTVFLLRIQKENSKICHKADDKLLCLIIFFNLWFYLHSPSSDISRMFILLYMAKWVECSPMVRGKLEVIPKSRHTKNSKNGI